MEAPDFDKDMEIDPDALDIEWMDQGKLALKYGRYLASIKNDVRHMEEMKKTKRSELIVYANKHPMAACGKEKPNAADIEAHYRNDQGYKDIITELNAVMEEAEFAEHAKNEICWTRKVALENLVRLHGQMYFAGPEIPRNLTEEYQARQKKVDGGIAKAMRRNKT